MHLQFSRISLHDTSKLVRAVNLIAQLKSKLASQS